MTKSPHFGQKRPKKSAPWHPRESDKKTLLKRVNRMSMMFIKVIIKDYPIVLDYQVDHLGKKSTL